MTLLHKITSPEFWKQPHVVAALLASVILLVYSNTFNASFHLDDVHQIQENEGIRTLSNLPKFFYDAGLSSCLKNAKRYQPFTIGSFAINYALTGYNVWSYHLVNIGLHVLNAFLVFILVSAILKKAGLKDPGRVSLPVSLAFALHPIQTRAVTYISGRGALMASIFFMSAMICFIRYRESEGGRARVYAVLVPSLFLAALWSKEIAATLIAVMALYDVLFTFSQEEGGMPRPKRALWLYVVLSAILVAFLALRQKLQGFLVEPGVAYDRVTFLMSEARAWLIYLRLMFFPVNQVFDYKLPATRSVDIFVLIYAVLVASAIALLYMKRKTDKSLVFFGAWFLITLSPESTFFPIQDIVVEYRMYLPSVGLITVIVLYAAGALRSHPSLKTSMGAAILVMFGILSFNRNSVYADEYSLWSDTLKKAPYSGRAHGRVAALLCEKGRYDEARKEYLTAVRIDPVYIESPLVYNGYGIQLMEKGQYGDAVNAFRKAIMMDPNVLEPYTNLGAVYYRMGMYKDAADILLKALKIDPKCGQAHFNLGMSYTELGRHGDALIEMEKAASLMAPDFELCYNLALAYKNNNMKAKALAQARRARELAQGDPESDDALSLISQLGG